MVRVELDRASRRSFRGGSLADRSGCASASGKRHSRRRPSRTGSMTSEKHPTSSIRPEDETIRPAAATVEPRPAPRFSIDYLDRSTSPSVDFYRFATGRWLDANPIPDDKVRWSAFDELLEG